MAKIDAIDFVSYVDIKKNDISDEINRILGYSAVTKKSSLFDLVNSIKQIQPVKENTEYFNDNWVDIETILEEDAEEFVSKWAYLIPDSLYMDIIMVPKGCLIKTSDGKVYENIDGTSDLMVEHIWDLSKDISNDNLLYNQRYVLVINKKDRTFYDINTLLNDSKLAGFGNAYYLELVIFNCNNDLYYFNPTFRDTYPTNSSTSFSERLLIEKLKFKNCELNNSIIELDTGYIYLHSIYFDSCNIIGNKILRFHSWSSNHLTISSLINLSDFIIEFRGNSDASIVTLNLDPTTLYVSTTKNRFIPTGDLTVVLTDTKYVVSFGSVPPFLKKLKIIGSGDKTSSSTIYYTGQILDLTEITNFNNINCSKSNVRVGFPLELKVSDNFEYILNCEKILSLNNKKIILKKCKDVSSEGITKTLVVGYDAIQAFPEEVAAAQLKGWTVS